MIGPMLVELRKEKKKQLDRNLYDFGKRAAGGAHGLVLTKPHIVDLILDLAGYKKGPKLSHLRLLEPACGHGVFVLAAVDRLLASTKITRRNYQQIAKAITAFDVSVDHVTISRNAVYNKLLEHSVRDDLAEYLSHTWVQQGDFLLSSDGQGYDFIVGNPPYVRIEQLPQTLQQAYRKRSSTLYDRADLYVAFIERGLRLLTRKGLLSFICADRWILNKYGRNLRKFITENFKLKYYIDLNHASPFESEVSAYPSIFVISQGKTKAVYVGALSTASESECKSLQNCKRAPHSRQAGVTKRLYPSWFQGFDPWILNSPEHLSLLRKLEARFPSLEAAGETRVGIGVATGSDKVYLVDENVDIERNRLVPIVMREDIVNGVIRNASVSSPKSG